MTLSRELARCQVAERAVGSTRIVVDPPGFDLGARTLDRREPRDIQTLIAQSPVERFYVAVVGRLSRVDEVELYAALTRPVLERFGSEFGTVIHRNRQRRACPFDGPIQGRDHIEAKPENLIGGRAYDIDQLDEQLQREGTELIAPHSSRCERKTQDGPRPRRYKRRCIVERFLAWMQWRRRLPVR